MSITTTTTAAAVVRKIQGYGWKKQLPDHRDHKYHHYHLLHRDLPAQVDLRPFCPSVYDQSDLGSCTANATAALAQFLLLKEGKTAFIPSRLFIYYNERVLEGTVANDDGAELRDGMKVLATQGVPHESLWWYNIAKFRVKPNSKVYADAALHLVSNYMSLDTETQYKSCLADGYPIVFGFSVYDSFETMAVARSGIMSLPLTTESCIGGHAVLIVGYNEAKQWYIVRNSWGIAWGDQGYFYMPYKYLHNPDLCSDFWTARRVA